MKYLDENIAKIDYLNAYERGLTLWPLPYSLNYVKTSFGSTHIIDSGDKAKQPLLLLHGGSMSSTMWYPNVLDWSKYYRVICIDILGDKNKSIPTKPFINRESYSVWLKEVMDSLQIEKASLVGLSYGALHALNFALHFPNRLNRVVLMSPAESFLSFKPEFYSYAFGMVQNEEGVDQFLDWIFANRYLLDEKMKSQLVAGMMWVEKERDTKPKDNGFPYVFTDKELSSVQVPILLLIGEHEVMYNPIEALERAKRFVPQLTAELIAGVGHLMSMEKPELINKRVLSFLTSE